ncbi:TPA: VENN motif pre-toxin domain-containing protein, partial [Neisseria subflava]
EMVAEEMLKGRDVSKDRQKIIGYSQIIAGSVVALFKGDVNIAANAAAVAVENNALGDPEIIAIGNRVDKECKGKTAECRNKIIGEAVSKSDKRSGLTQPDIAAITAVQNKYQADALDICKGNSACATFVGNKFTYARLHCASTGCMSELSQLIIRETSVKYGSLWDTTGRIFNDFSPFLPVVKVPKISPNNYKFASEEKLLSHFTKHSSELGATTVDEYLKIGRDVIKNGIPIRYEYSDGIRNGFVQYYGNTGKGIAKFIFVGTNHQGNITTIHVKSGKEFWKAINRSNPKDKTIYEVK